jgi:hypothetical protein
LFYCSFPEKAHLSKLLYIDLAARRVNPGHFGTTTWHATNHNQHASAFLIELARLGSARVVLARLVLVRCSSVGRVDDTAVADLVDLRQKAKNEVNAEALAFAGSPLPSRASRASLRTDKRRQHESAMHQQHQTRHSRNRASENRNKARQADRRSCRCAARRGLCAGTGGSCCGQKKTNTNTA